MANESESLTRKRMFIMLRYAFIIAAGYLILVEGRSEEMGSTIPLLIAGALASNVLLALIPEGYLFGWGVQVPVLIADTLWIAYSLSVPGQIGQQFFLLYFFVLTLAAVGESLATALIGALLIGTADCYLSSQGGSIWESPALIRIPFFFTLALFYGHIGIRSRADREREIRDREVAHELERLVQLRTQEANARAAAMETLYQQAAEANRMKTEFVATMSHELLSPLHVILGYGDLLATGLTGHLDEPARELVDRMQLNGRRLLSMVRNILDLAQLDGGDAQPVLAPVDLGQLAASLISPTSLARPEHLRVRTEVPANLPTAVTDAHKLRIMLAHLLSNAVKFTAEGEVVLRIRFDAATDMVHCTVSDTGIGLRAEDVNIIFEDFRQLDSSLRRRYEGVGLGLAIVRRCAKLLGGHVLVSSTLGKGSNFTFVLPCHANGAVESAHPEEPVRQVA